MKKIIKISNIVLAIFLITIAIGVAYIAIPVFGNNALIVRSGSMSPTIDVGSVVVVRESSYKVGDIIAFKSNSDKEILTTHRIIEKVVDGDKILYKTQGDANKTPDETLVYQENILGKTSYIIPYVGKIMAFAKSDLGFPLFIIFPALFVIFLEIISIIKEVRKKRTKKEPFGFENEEISKAFSKNIISLKLIVPFIAFNLFVPSTIAYFSDSEISNGNVFQASDLFPQIAQLYESNPYTCSGGASNTTSKFGSVKISKNSDLTVEVILSGALPNTDYDLWVNQDPGACPLPSPTVSNFITTDSSGNGSNLLTEHTLIGTATNFWVSMVSTGNSQVLRSTSVSF